MVDAMELWEAKFSDSAQREGWNIWLRTDGILDIEGIDCPDEGDGCPDPNPLASDADALAHCFREAMGGSYMHCLALFLDGRKSSDVTIPAVAGQAKCEADVPVTPPIVIEVSGGVVQDVHSVPRGVAYEVHDYDISATDEHVQTDDEGGKYVVTLTG